MHKVPYALQSALIKKVEGAMQGVDTSIFNGDMLVLMLYIALTTYKKCEWQGEGYLRAYPVLFI